MPTFCVLMSFVLVIAPSFATIDPDDVNFKIFTHIASFENNIRQSRAEVERFLDDHKSEVDGSVPIENYEPYAEQIIAISSVLTNELENQEWRQALAESIANKSELAMAVSDVTSIQVWLKSIQEDVPALTIDDPTLDDVAKQAIKESFARYMHEKLGEIIETLNSPYATLQTNPLFGAPLVIEIALLIAVSTPAVRQLVPSVANQPQLSCKVQQSLLDYRPRTVDARVDRFSVYITPNENKLRDWQGSFLMNETHVLAQPDSGFGEGLDCVRGCTETANEESTACLKDFLNEDEYYVGMATSEDAGELWDKTNNLCAPDYTRLVRHRVENFFPTDMLDLLCDKQQPQPAPTGFGWFTIRIKNIFVWRLQDGDKCACNPYVQLFINGEEVCKTLAKDATNWFDPDVLYTSEKIPKDSTIKVEVNDSNGDELIASVEENLNGLLGFAYRAFNTEDGEPISQIQIVSYWQDEMN